MSELRWAFVLYVRCMRLGFMQQTVQIRLHESAATMIFLFLCSAVGFLFGFHVLHMAHSSSLEWKDSRIGYETRVNK